jgi:hypothetical protein
VLVLAKVTQTSVIEDASEHKRQAMGGAIVDDLRRKYPGLVVKRQELPLITRSSSLASACF